MSLGEHSKIGYRPHNPGEASVSRGSRYRCRASLITSIWQQNQVKLKTSHNQQSRRSGSSSHDVSRESGAKSCCCNRSDPSLRRNQKYQCSYLKIQSYQSIAVKNLLMHPPRQWSDQQGSQQTDASSHTNVSSKPFQTILRSMQALSIHQAEKMDWVRERSYKNRAASAHQTNETQISLVAFCSVALSLECADHFDIRRIVRLFSYCCLDYRQWTWRTSSCWIFLVVYIVYVFLWHSTFTSVISLCPTIGIRLAAQEKAQEIKADSKTKDLTLMHRSYRGATNRLTQSGIDAGRAWLLFRCN